MSVLRQAGEGERIAIGPVITVMKAAAEETGGTFSFSETIAGPGFPGPPAHIHDVMYDGFYVLDGTLTVRVGDEERELGPGDFACASPGTVHTFSNGSDQEVRFLNVQTPGGFEGYLREMSEAMAGGDYDPEAARKIAARYDIRYPDE